MPLRTMYLVIRTGMIILGRLGPVLRASSALLSISGTSRAYLARRLRSMQISLNVCLRRNHSRFRLRTSSISWLIIVSRRAVWWLQLASLFCSKLIELEDQIMPNNTEFFKGPSFEELLEQALE